MTSLLAALQVEGLKLRKSKMLWTVLAAFTIAPLMGGFFMFVLKNPEFAKSTGMLGTKAQIAGEATWPSYFSMLAQIIAVGGILVYGFVASWVFGREYTDRTLKDLLALPYHRYVVVVAKFLVIFIAAGLLSVYVVCLGVLIGGLIGLSGWTSATAMDGFLVLLITAVLAISLSTPVAFFACLGRGYLAPLGFIIMMVVFAQIIAAIGYGAYFPWAVPALFSGITGEGHAIRVSSFLIVFFTGLAGFIGTLVWWLYADQH